MALKHSNEKDDDRGDDAQDGFSDCIGSSATTDGSPRSITFNAGDTCSNYRILHELERAAQVELRERALRLQRALNKHS